MAGRPKKMAAVTAALDEQADGLMDSVRQATVDRYGNDELSGYTHSIRAAWSRALDDVHRTGGPGCFNLGSRFDLAASRITGSTVGREAIAPPGSQNLIP